MRSFVFVLMFSLAAAVAQAQFQVPPPSDVAAPPADAQKTASGLATKVIKPGQGTAHPQPTDIVMLNYTEWTTDGKTFDSNFGKGPAFWPVNKLLPGLTEGIQLMVAGETRRMWLPEAIAHKGRNPKGTVVFEIEVLTVQPNSTPATSR
jgi:peptidylprolyl isomerase